MAWCEANGVHYVFGLARNARLEAEIEGEQAEAEQRAANSGKAERIFKEFRYKTRQSWSCERRVVAKAKHLAKGPNPRFIVTSLTSKMAAARELYEKSIAPAARWKTASRNASSISWRTHLHRNAQGKSAPAVVLLACLCAGNSTAPPCP